MDETCQHDPELEPDDDDGPVDASDAAACVEALRQFFAEDFAPGAFVSRDWLHEALGVPHARTANNYDSMQRLTFQFLNRFDAFQRALLLRHRIALQSVRGQGYRLVLPGEQSRWAVTEALRELRRAMNKGFGRARHVNLDALTDTEKCMQQDDLSRLRSLRQLVNEREAAQRRKERYNELGQDPEPDLPERERDEA